MKSSRTLIIALLLSTPITTNTALVAADSTSHTTNGLGGSTSQITSGTQDVAAFSGITSTDTISTQATTAKITPSQTTATTPTTTSTQSTAVTTTSTATSKDLTTAIAKKDISKTQKIIAQKPALVNKQDANGLTPVMLAVQKQDPKLVNTLLVAKPNLKKRTNKKNTALAIAIQQAQGANGKKIVTALLKNGAPVTSLSVRKLMKVAKEKGFYKQILKKYPRRIIGFNNKTPYKVTIKLIAPMWLTQEDKKKLNIKKHALASNQKLGKKKILKGSRAKITVLAPTPYKKTIRLKKGKTYIIKKAGNSFKIG